MTSWLARSPVSPGPAARNVSTAQPPLPSTLTCLTFPWRRQSEIPSRQAVSVNWKSKHFFRNYLQLNIYTEHKTLTGRQGWRGEREVEAEISLNGIWNSLIFKRRAATLYRPREVQNVTKPGRWMSRRLFGKPGESARLLKRIISGQ